MKANFVKNVVSDLSRLKKPTKKNFVKLLLFNRAFKFTFWYRVSSCYKSLIWRLIYRHYYTKYNIFLPLETSIMGGVKFPHLVGIVITEKAIIGHNCTIFQNVTIGCNIKGNLDGPIIGNDVTICAGAKIIGAIKIGDNSIIGAGAVVVRDVPSNCIATGVPAMAKQLNI